MSLQRLSSFIVAVGVAALVLLFGSAFLAATERQHVSQHRVDASRLAAEYARALQLQLDRALDVGRIIGGVLESNGGNMDAVDDLARDLVAMHGGVSMVGLAPDYVLARIVPGPGDPDVVGVDLMRVPMRRSQILAATERGTLALQGPQPLQSGTIGFVTDVPVTLDDGTDWGLVVVAFELADLLSASGLDRLDEAGYAYRLVVEDRGGEAVTPTLIASTAGAAEPNALDDPVGTAISVPQGTWMLYVTPKVGWDHNTDRTLELILVVAVAALVSFLAFDLVRRPERMRDEINQATGKLAQVNRRLQAEVATRQQVENALRRSEERILAILRHAADAIVTIDDTGSIRDFNSAAGAIFGYTLEDVAGQQIGLLLPGTTVASLAAYFPDEGSENAAASRPAAILFNGRAASGDALDLVVALSRVQVQSNWLYTLILRDHTAQNRAERALRETRAQLSTVVGKAPIVVFAVDRTGTFTLSEGRGLARIGRAPGEVVGKSIYDIYSEYAEVRRAIDAALVGKPQTIVIRIGRTVFDVWYSPLYNEVDEIDGAFGVAYDITELKEAEEALVNVINTVADGVVTADARGTILMANQRMTDIFGYAPEAMVGKPITMLFPEEAHDRIRGCLAYQDEKAPGERPGHAEMEGLHQDRRRLALEVTVAPTHVGEQRHFTASFRDVSAQKELAQMRDDFISTVSHELRTPLAALIGWLETLLGGRPGPLTSEQQRFLSMALEGGERLNLLVEEILTVTRIGEGKLHLQAEPFDPRDVLVDAIDIIDSQVSAHGITVQREDEWPAGALVVADRYRIEQVMTNLVSNAIKFSPEGSTVVVRSMLADNAWRFEVIDEGIGIPAAEVEKLYDRYYRASNVRNTHMQGTGLGLYVSRAIIEKHGGTLGHNRRTGTDRGTVAWFELPVERVLVEPPAPVLT